jgi:uncharacterized protein YjdB
MAACGTGPETSPAELVFSVQAPSYVSTISVEITGQGIDTALVLNFTVTNGTASGTARVTAGSARRIVGRAFDAATVNTHRGDTTVTLVEGPNAALTMVLRPLMGDQPVTITIGRAALALSRGDTSIAVGDTLRFAATGTTWNNRPIPTDSLRWASSNPAVASVSTAGLATALAAGTTSVAASYEGATARRILTVR